VCNRCEHVSDVVTHTDLRVSTNETNCRHTAVVKTLRRATRNSRLIQFSSCVSQFFRSRANSSRTLELSCPEIFAPLAPRSFRSLELYLLGTFAPAILAPGGECSRELPPWNIRFLKLSLPNICNHIFNNCGVNCQLSIRSGSK